MEPLRLVHLSGPRRGEAELVHALPATLGSEAGLAVVLAGAAPRHAVLAQDGADVVLRDAGSGRGTYLADEAVSEAVLRDGDVLELGKGGPRLRFEQERVERRGLLQTGIFRTIPRRTSRAFRLLLALVVVAGGGILGWTYRESRRLETELAGLREAVRSGALDRERLQARIDDERRRTEKERHTLESMIEESKQREEELAEKLTAAASGEVQALRNDLAQARQRLATLEGERAAGERIIRDYGAGVCLIQGAYAFYDTAGRPLRIRLDEEGRPMADPGGALILSLEADGPIHTIDYFGTGFLADPRGLVLSNRHVAQPWWKDETARAVASRGFTPRFVTLRAFFPGKAEAFRLEVLRLSEAADLGLLRVDLGSRRVPVLPLDDGRGAVAGQPVVVVGYPTGLDAILAKADGGVVQEILDAHGTDSLRVTEALSRRGLIRPSTTQGHIGDVTVTDIVFDAPTTQGGSGGPVFNRNGKVVAVEYAVLPRFGGNAFGVPIRHALALLKEPKKPGG
jgi:pSer/pThr/pTyr-binding forkhead associated (FHA) protein